MDRPVTATNYRHHDKSRTRTHYYPPDQFNPPVGVTFPVHYLGHVQLDISLTSPFFTAFCLSLAKESIRRIRGCPEEDRVHHSLAGRHIANQYPVSEPASAIASLTLSHITLILANTAEVMQHSINRVAFAYADARYVTFAAEDDRLGNIFAVLQLEPELAKCLVHAFEQVFDMNQHQSRPASPDPPSSSPSSTDYSTNYEDLHRQPWFHSHLNRTEAEALLSHEGDFLVRYSSTLPGQVVLSTFTASRHLHLQLLDPVDGQVRNHAGKHFRSVAHFIDAHFLADLALYYADGTRSLHLMTPILNCSPRLQRTSTLRQLF